MAALSESNAELHRERVTACRTPSLCLRVFAACGMQAVEFYLLRRIRYLAAPRMSSTDSSAAPAPTAAPTITSLKK